MDGYRFELVTGPMGCGKTEELIRRITRAKIAGKSVKVFYPAIDTRSSENCIQSRTGAIHSAIKVDNSIEILALLNDCDEVIGIDELQFFDEEIADVVLRIIKSGKKIIGSGLELDFKSDAFGSMPQLFCYADKVDKLTAVCMKCGSEFGTRTQRLIDGKPAHRFSPLIMVGGDERYEARCLNCYEIGDSLIQQSELASSSV